MKINCPICNQQNIDKKHPYSFHKIKYANFIEKYYPRQDLSSKEPIKFKSEDSYFSTDFNDRRNLKKYLESRSKDEGLDYLKNWLLKRKEIKLGFCFNLTEFETRTLMFPTIEYIEKYYGAGTYRNLCLESNLQYRNDYEYIPKFNRNIEGRSFIQDTREQKGIKLPNMVIQTLPFGDYTLEKSNFYIERKSLADFLGTTSQGYKRFKNEIERCRQNNSFLLVLVEESYKNLQSFEYLSYIRSKCSWSFISHRVRELMQEFPLHVQFLAVNGRKEATRTIEKVFKMEQCGIPDFQFLYNKGLL